MCLHDELIAAILPKARWQHETTAMGPPVTITPFVDAHLAELNRVELGIGVVDRALLSGMRTYRGAGRSEGLARCRSGSIFV